MMDDGEGENDLNNAKKGSKGKKSQPGNTEGP